MQVDDIPAVVELGNTLFTAETSPTLYRYWEEAEVLQIYTAYKDTCLVATNNDKVVGFALGTLLEKPGSRVGAGQLLGNVGGPTNNGNWFPHLHAQIVRGRFATVDGYGAFSVGNQRRFPDPFRFWPPQYDCAGA